MGPEVGISILYFYFYFHGNKYDTVINSIFNDFLREVVINIFT